MRGDFEGVRSWSDAPEDILSLILSKLCAGDANAFYVVCKTWSKVTPHVRTRNILKDEELCTCPILIFPNKGFFHPLYNIWFQLDTIPTLPEGVILAQNHGWLLLKLRDHHPFFYNPSTGKQIDLPASPIGWTTFSAPPTSSDCEIFYFSKQIRHQIVVHTIKRGEALFGCENVCKSKSFIWSHENKAVFFQGKYYGLGKGGNLVIYHPKKNKQCRVINAPIHLWKHFYTNDCGRYLFEGEGDLWAVFVAFQGEEVCVLKLNLSNMCWEIINNLGDKMIFLNYQSCMIERTTIKGAGNKIYFPKLMRGHCMFYSLTTKKFHTFEKGSIYDSFCESKDMPRCTWIKMNIDMLSNQTCSKNLIW